MNTFLKEKKKDQFVFGTKAETLERLKGCLQDVHIAKVYYFSVQQWQENKNSICDEIQKKFTSQRYLIIRSSAICEDSFEQSMAGAFCSCLNVDSSDMNSLCMSIEKVVSSYDGNINNQILIQPMVTDIAVSGVIMTRNLEDGAPYYVINYDDNSGRTDSITGGTGVHKTVLISRLHNENFVDSKRLAQMLRFAKHIEEVCGAIPLDIEFGLTHDEQMYLFQVRPIVIWKKWDDKIEQRVFEVIPEIEQMVSKYSLPIEGILGTKTILATMPDWNPAEIIGSTPKPLAASLYRDLITKDVWRQAREEMGYRSLPEEELMVMIKGRPFINVRNSFNSFLPASINDTLGEKLISSWLDRLDKHPELHDKVEFDIVQTCMNFTFDKEYNSRYGGLLTKDEENLFKDSLVSLTRECLDVSSSGSLSKALKKLNLLKIQQDKRNGLSVDDYSKEDLIKYIQELITECKAYGTLPFSIMARHAFIAESFLRSAVERGALDESRVRLLKTTLQTITTDLAFDLEAVCKGSMQKDAFIKKYGHLRPGTYDITSLRYADRKNLFDECAILQEEFHIKEFILEKEEEVKINQLLSEVQLDHIEANQLLEYIKQSIVGREYGKFIFTRNISDVLEGIVLLGGKTGFSREDLSYLELDKILELAMLGKDKVSDRSIQAIEQGKSRVNLAKEIKLSYIIRDIKDVHVVPIHRSAPNFIGCERIEGQIVLINAHTTADVNLHEKIVCIENADPGFDWIFTKGIKALITKYGGTNSHMAIRCAEFGLPAAIGCGEVNFDRLLTAQKVELNCADKILRPLYRG